MEEEEEEEDSSTDVHLPEGASAQDVLRILLPPVVKAAADGARATTAAAAAVSSLEDQVEALVGEVRRLKEALDGKEDAKQEAAKTRLEYVRVLLDPLKSIFTPQTVVLIIIILASAVGIRVTLPQGVQVETPTPPTPETAPPGGNP